MGHLVAYAARHYIDTPPRSGQNGFPSAGERRLIIIYGYLGWCIGPLVATILLLELSRLQSATSLPQHSSPLEEPTEQSVSTVPGVQRRWGTLVGVYVFAGVCAAYVFTDSLWFFVLATFPSMFVFCLLVVWYSVSSRRSRGEALLTPDRDTRSVAGSRGAHRA